MIPKYKAWDKEEKIWLEIKCLGLWADNELWYLETEDDKHYFEDDLGVKWELLQSTGLKDKNDVEIFEGDVIHLTSNNGIDYKALIIFKDGGFCAVDGVEDEYSTRRYQLHKGDCDFEVLGNQFEHPHLLEE